MDLLSVYAYVHFCLCPHKMVRLLLRSLNERWRKEDSVWKRKHDHGTLSVVVFPLKDERGQLGTSRVRKMSNLRVHISGCSPGTFEMCII